MENKNRFVKDLLWFFVFWGVVAGVFRIFFGLGATTNLSDQIPWGLWKVLNMIAGVALSTCGFTVGFLAYVLKIEKFKPFVRPAILIAFLGYGSSCLALAFDIGLPHKFWHPFIYWNIHSFLFEVFWCVILYFTVTTIELAPNILERFKTEKAVKFLHNIAIVAVIIGISLSSLHHSSLGSLFLTTPQRLHELWYSPLLPLLFILSAMGGGMMFLIIAKMFYAYLNNPTSVFGPNFGDKSNLVCAIDGKLSRKIPKVFGPDMPRMQSLAIIAASIMGVYLAVKIYDLVARGSISALFAGTWESWLFGVEIILTAIVPIVLIAIPSVRRTPAGLGFAAASASLGVVLNRMDVGIFGFFRDAGIVYVPSLAEIALSLGVIAGAALAFLYISENFTIFDDYRKKAVGKGVFQAAFDSLSRVWKTALQSGLYRVSLIAVVAFPLAFVLMWPPYSSPDKTPVEPAKGIDVERATLLIDGNSSREKVEFPHAEHQKRLGGKQGCSECHHISMPNDRSTPCYRCHGSMIEETRVFDHDAHFAFVAEDRGIGGPRPENVTCIVCHAEGEAKTADNAASCAECHFDDMNFANDPKLPPTFVYATSYVNAMHENCIPCHECESARLNKPELGECSGCHKVLFDNPKKSSHVATK